MARTVAVVITNFNHGSLLPRAVSSVLAQTRAADQFIVVDDCSTDNSASVLDRLPKSVRVIRRSVNGGVIAARNQALSLISTDFVVFLDADDELLPGFLRTTLRSIQRPPNRRLAVVYTPARMLNGHKRGYMHSRGYDRLRLAERNYISNTSLIRVQALREAGGYAPVMEQVGHEDWDLFLTLAEQGWRGRLVARPLFLYRTLPGSRNSRSLLRDTEVRRLIESRHPWVASPKRGRKLRKVARAVVAARQRIWREVDFRLWSQEG